MSQPFSLPFVFRRTAQTLRSAAPMCAVYTAALLPVSPTTSQPSQTDGQGRRRRVGKALMPPAKGLSAANRDPPVPSGKASPYASARTAARRSPVSPARPTGWPTSTSASWTPRPASAEPPSLWWPAATTWQVRSLARCPKTRRRSRPRRLTWRIPFRRRSTATPATSPCMSAAPSASTATSSASPDLTSPGRSSPSAGRGSSWGPTRCTATWWSPTSASWWFTTPRCGTQASTPA